MPGPHTDAVCLDAGGAAVWESARGEDATGGPSHAKLTRSKRSASPRSRHVKRPCRNPLPPRVLTSDTPQVAQAQSPPIIRLGTPCSSASSPLSDAPPSPSCDSPDVDRGRKIGSERGRGPDSANFSPLSSAPPSPSPTRLGTARGQAVNRAEKNPTGSRPRSICKVQRKKLGGARRGGVKKLVMGDALRPPPQSALQGRKKASKSAKGPNIVSFKTEPVQRRSKGAKAGGRRVTASLLASLGIPPVSQPPISQTPQAARKELLPVPPKRTLPPRHLVPPKHAPLRLPGVRSSTFARFLRLVLDSISSGHPPTDPGHKAMVPPALTGRPPVWAESRQELCEALPYYRAFQSGLYMHGRVAFGYLLDSFPAPRDVWAQGGRVIISHGGGQCMRTNDADGSSRVSLQADQRPTDARIDTLLNAATHRTPIVLLAGEGYDLLPFRLGCAYVVLGWYWISTTWVEAEPVSQGVKPPKDRDYFHRVKLRFDWIGEQGSPWWLEEGGDKPLSQPRHGNMASDHCASVTSPPPMLRSLSVAELCGVPPLGDDFPPDDKGKVAKAPGGEQRSGLLTPPVTPPERDPLRLEARLKRGSPSMMGQQHRIVPRRITPPTLGFEIDEARSPASSAAEMDDEGVQQSSCGEAPPTGRYPGDYLLTRFDDLLERTSDDSQPPFADMLVACPGCRHSFPRIYRESWICLNPSCLQFWMIHTPLGSLPIPPGFALHLSPDFLAHVEAEDGSGVPYGLVPPVPGGVEPCADVEAGSRSLWKGWVCDRCGRANCRYRWEMWECRSCGNRIGPLDANGVVSASDVSAIDRPLLGDGRIHPGSGFRSSIRRLQRTAATVIQYQIPSAGKIYHILHERTDNADRLFEAYQRAAVDTDGPLFQRRAIKMNTVKGQLLAQHFAVNSGAQYKYIVETLSLPFEASPSCVVEARDLIRERVSEALEEDVAFNEVLSVLYREGQKMSWHDDGEDGLGPVIASLSLGSSATMSFRPKIPRYEPNATFALGKAPPGKRRKPVNPPTALSITLSHGDILVMQGRRLQKLYDHRVVPSGFRVAATARVIG